MTQQINLFVDTQGSLSRLSHMGDPLERLKTLVDWEKFRSTLEDAVADPDRKAFSGRKRFDVVMMLRILAIKRFYQMGDDTLHYLIRDRLSYMRFIGVEAGHHLPSRATINSFMRTIKNLGLYEDLMEQIEQQLRSQRFRIKRGKVLDVCFIRTSKAMGQSMPATEPHQEI